MIHVLADDEVRPVAMGLRLLRLLRGRHPRELTLAGYATANNPPGAHHLDRLIGTADVRPVIFSDDGGFEERVRQWTDAGDWAARVADDLIYPRH